MLHGHGQSLKYRLQSILPLVYIGNILLGVSARSLQLEQAERVPLHLIRIIPAEESSLAPTQTGTAPLQQ